MKQIDWTLVRENPRHSGVIHRHSTENQHLPKYPAEWFFREDALLVVSPCADAMINAFPEALKSAVRHLCISGARGLFSIFDTIPAGCFAGWENLESVEVQSKHLHIRERAFQDCGKLTSLLLPEKLDGIRIHTDAFSGCSLRRDGSSLLDDAGGYLIHFDKDFQGEYHIPSTVRKLAIRAFAGCSGLTAVTAPPSLSRISTEAFADCENLASVTLSGQDAMASTFKGCSKLFREDGLAYDSTGTILLRCHPQKQGACPIPETVRELLPGAFEGCGGITEVSLPEAVTRIPAFAFQNCTALETVTVPDALEEIGTYAFDGCAKLQNIRLPGTLKEIKDFAFSGCRSLTRLELPVELRTLREAVFQNCASLTEVVIPNGIASIRAATFQGCTSLRSVLLPTNLLHIDGGAFRDCTALTQLTLPGSVSEIKDLAFSGCTSLEVMLPRGIRKVGNRAFEHVPHVLYRDYASGWSKSDPFNPFWEDGNRFWGAQRYNDLSHISSSWEFADGTLTVCAPVVAEGEWQQHLAHVRHLRLLPGCLEIGSDTFCALPLLESVSFPASLRIIGSKAFSDCPKLQQVQLPEKLQSLGTAAFQNCASLQQVTIPGSLLSIGAFAFESCAALEKLTIGQGVREIQEHAFDGCESLRELVLPDSFSRMHMYAFMDCKALETVQLSFRQRSIPVCCFAGCESLREIRLPQHIWSIGEHAFDGCTALSHLEIPESVTEIGDEAFCEVPHVTYHCTLPGKGWGEISHN